MFDDVVSGTNTFHPKVARRKSARGVIGAGVAAAAIVAAGAVASNAQSAGASAAEHTQNFQAQATSQLTTGGHSYVVADQDVAGSTVVGHDILTCVATRTHSTCDVAFAQTGGLLYAHFVLRDADRSLVGQVHGGTGRYRDADGTMNGAAVSRSVVRVTLHYVLDGS